jgi:hypothetical protein
MHSSCTRLSTRKERSTRGPAPQGSVAAVGVNKDKITLRFEFRRPKSANVKHRKRNNISVQKTALVEKK